MDLDRGTRQLLASGGAVFPILTSDDRQATIFRREGIFWQPTDGGGDPATLVDREAPDVEAVDEVRPQGTLVPTSWNPRTGDLAFFDDASDIWVRQTDGSVQPFLHSDANERTGRSGVAIFPR